MANRWERQAERLMYKGYRNVIRRTYLNHKQELVDFDLLQNADYVTVAAFTPFREAILIKQFRPGPEKILTSFVEGRMEGKEIAERAAARELLEETGYKAQKITLLTSLYKSYATQQQWLLVAENCEKVALQNLDATEDIEVFTMPYNDFRHMLRQPAVLKFHNLECAYLALDFLGWL